MIKQLLLPGFCGKGNWSCLTGRFQLGFCCAAVRCWLDLGYLLPRWFDHKPGSLVLACIQGSQLLSTWASSKGGLSVIMTWQLVFSRVRDPREQGRSSSAFYDLALEVTHHHIWHILLVTQCQLCINMGRAQIHGDMNPLRTQCRLTATISISLKTLCRKGHVFYQQYYHK